MEWLLAPTALSSRSDVLIRDAVPGSPGVYAWFFRQIPPSVPNAGCVVHNDLTLLYVGIAPKAPPKDGGKASSQTLRHRIRCHFNGNAEGSTLRLTLGCLLSESLGIELRRVGGGKRFTFGPGEATLSEWMETNAFVCWTVTDSPWEVEKAIIGSVCLPLNLDQSRSHAFHATLTKCRAEAKRRARGLAVL